MIKLLVFGVCVLVLFWVCFLFVGFALLFVGFLMSCDDTCDWSFYLKLQLHRIPSTGRCDSHLCASWEKNIY